MTPTNDERDAAIAKLADALILLAATTDYRLLDPDTDCEYLFERQLIRQYRDITDEYQCCLTEQGTAFVSEQCNLAARFQPKPTDDDK